MRPCLIPIMLTLLATLSILSCNSDEENINVESTDGDASDSGRSDGDSDDEEQACNVLGGCCPDEPPENFEQNLKHCHSYCEKVIDCMPEEDREVFKESFIESCREDCWKAYRCNGRMYPSEQFCGLELTCDQFDLCADRLAHPFRNVCYRLLEMQTQCPNGNWENLVVGDDWEEMCDPINELTIFNVDIICASEATCEEIDSCISAGLENLSSCKKGCYSDTYCRYFTSSDGAQSCYQERSCNENLGPSEIDLCFGQAGFSDHLNCSIYGECIGSVYCSEDSICGK